MAQILLIPNPNTMMWLPHNGEAAWDAEWQPPAWATRGFTVPTGMRWQATVHGDLVVVRPAGPLQPQLRRKTLSPVQRTLVALIASGYTLAQIAIAVHMTPRQVRYQLKKARQIMGVQTTEALARQCAGQLADAIDSETASVLHRLMPMIDV